MSDGSGSSLTTEELRLRELISLDLLDTESETEFDQIVELASLITGCPISLISLVDRKRQWFKAKVGLSADETAREISFCTHAIESSATFVVADASTDPRFQKNPLVQGNPNIRFYAGQPLVTSNGHRLGTLCAMDRVPRQLTNAQLTQLELLAKQTVRMMEMRIVNRKLGQTQSRLKEVIQEVSVAREIAQAERTKFEEAFAQASVPLALLEGPDHRFAFVNKKYVDLFELERSPVGLTFSELLGDADARLFLDSLDAVYQTGKPFSARDVLLRRRLSSGKLSEHYIDFTYAAKRNAANEIEGILAVIVDVTAAVQLRKALEETQDQLTLERNKLEQFLNSIPAPMIFVRGEELIIDTLNPAYQAIFPDRQLVGLPFEVAIEEMKDQEFPRIFRDVLATGTPFHAKNYLTKIKNPATGLLDDVYYDFSYLPVYDSDGFVYGVLDHAVDVTASVRSRQQLEASEERVRKYAEAMPQMAFTADALGNITYFNKRFYDYVGLAAGAGKGREWESVPIHHPDDLQRTIDRWNQSVRTGEPYEIEYRLRRADGTYRWHLGRAVADRDSSGNIIEWFGTNTDIHDLRVAQENVRDAEATLSLALTSADIGFWDWDAKTGYTTLSDTLLRAFGMSKADFKHTLDEPMARIHPDDRERVWNDIQASTFEKRRYDVEYRVIRPDGIEIYVNAKGQFFIDDDGKSERLTGVTIDITNRKRAEQELRDAQLAAEEANSAKSAFLANMSYEIRTPLGAIMGFAELAQQSGALSEQASSFVDVVQRNSVQVLKIVDDILDLAKVEAGKVLIEKVEVDLIGFIADFGSLLGFRARENGITLKIEALTDLPEYVMMDPTRVRQVLTNIVGNAIKFTSNGTVSLHICFHDGVLEFAVRDTGRGISQEQAAVLFQPFVQADISTTRKYGGTGLGLVLTKRLCQTMGGDFVLKHSQLGVGSHFLATIEVQPTTHSKMLLQQDIVFRQSVKKTDRVETQLPLLGIRVLLVEDSPDNQELLRVILEKQGVVFALANNGAEGVKRAMKETFDVVLMDVQMPVMDGHEAVSTLRANGYKRPVIALTAHAMREEYERAMKSGFTDYLSKPVNRAALTEKISKYGRISH